MRTRRTLSVFVLGFGSLAFLASGAAADWLVTSDGAKLEIDGPWSVDGKLVTFTLPNGTLGSMPLTALDLEASRAWTDKSAAAGTEPSTEEPVKKKAVFVITDADVGHPRTDASPGDEAGASTEADQDQGLRVTGWREDVDLSRNSVRITGSLQNPTVNPATSIELDVMLYNDSGGLLETSRARLEQGFLNPGASIRFEAAFQDTLSFDSVRFGIRSRGFMSNPPPDEEEEGESDSPPEQ